MSTSHKPAQPPAALSSVRFKACAQSFKRSGNPAAQANSFIQVFVLNPK
jgi:hypothetical protein